MLINIFNRQSPMFKKERISMDIIVNRINTIVEV